MKTLQSIPFTDLDSIPALIKDFISGKLEFFKEHLFTDGNINKKLEAKKNNFTTKQRELLATLLGEQMQTLTMSTEQISNLKLLKENTTFTITTGHQLNLFTGPVFFIYKILQTIKTAEYLAQNFPQYNFVPLFWMATEDHDFEEISFFQSNNHRYTIRGEEGGVVGTIQPVYDNLFKDFYEEFKDSPYGPELIQLINDAYLPENNLSQATRKIVQHLFSEMGLLIIDGDHKSLKEQMISVFEDELRSSSLKNSSAEKVDYLSEKYGKVQVNPREINLFYLTKTRNRIEAVQDGYQIIDTELFFTENEMLTELKLHPEKFSPNALMRPVFQETVLPNIAYIGGNAEIMYWLELVDYFQHIGLPFPILIPRNSFLMLKEKTVDKLNSLDIVIPDILNKLDTLTQDKMVENLTILDEINTLNQILRHQFQKLKEVSKATDITFENLVDAEQTRQLKSFERMKKRLLRAEKIKQKELLERLEILYNTIHPKGIWQERVLNFSVFYAEFGRTWLQFCLNTMSVDNPELVIVQI